MADTGIQWSSTSGHMRVGIKFVYDSVGSSTTSSTVRCELYVRAVNYGFDDNQTITWSGSKSGSKSYYFYSPFGGNSEKEVADISIGELSTSYSGGPSRTITATLSGVYGGGTPSKTYTFTLPARPASKPSAPNSSWSNLQSDRVTVSCSTPSSNGATITDYDIQVDNNSDFSSPVVSNASRGQVVTGLTPGTKYYIRSRAQNSVGESTWSTREDFTTLAAVPNKPNEPTVSNITNTSVQVNYVSTGSNGSTITDYEVQLATNSGFSSGVRLESGGSTPHVFTGLTPATDYWVRVRAVNGIGAGPWSNSKSFESGATTAQAPTGLDAPTIAKTYADLDWNAPADDGGSPITAYQVQYATNAGFSQNVQTVTTVNATPEITLNNLYSGMTWYTRVRGVNVAGAGAWSTVLEVDTLEGVPAIISPANNAIAGALGRLSVVYHAVGLYGASQIEVKVSRSGESYYRTLELETKSPNDQYTIADPTLYLGPGGWVLRARVYNEQQDTYTAWSPSTAMQQSHVPTAQVVSPIGGSIFKYESNVPFTFGFVDPAGSYDRMTAYQVVIEQASSGVPIFDSGKVASVAPYGSSQGTVAVSINPGYKNYELRWRVKVWDEGDAPSAWSGYSLFTLAEEPDVTITNPTNGSTIITGAPNVTWTSDMSLAATQKSAEISIVDSTTSEEVYSATVQGAVFAKKPPTAVLSNLSNYDVTITVTDTNDVVGSSTANFDTEYESPDPVGYDTDPSQINESGFVLIDWRNAIADAQFTEWKVYRRVSGESVWELLVTLPDVNIREYRDYMITAGTSYLYSVTQTALRSGEPVEGPVGFRDDGGDVVTENRAAVPPLDTYWIIDPINGDKSVQIPSVDSDDSTLEFEDSSYTIIGRGRHRDYGDELGYTGSLTSKVRRPERPSSVRLAVEALRREKRTFYLRTPHGRLFPVALGNIGWSPISGVGTFEMGDMTIPYEEVD